MDLQSRKIEFVQEFLKLQSEEAISRLEKLLKIEKKWDGDELEPMTVKELNERIDKSMEDSKNGRLTEVNQLLAEIEKWT
ncbi:hypothetical protein SAMN05421636_1323 [Pricia antarctica]|uniref:Addiction module component n=1 Tax=Pricia antarctica TaxID=641691 RepID=A0A1G7JKD7_9FLAO|nr:hypothetical protein [Pricia antarctica]SDF25432.1 hypothetical protein SAMN05421636_1323 [Pricia antarctica]